jgi:AraC-like DNA-binding protein
MLISGDPAHIRPPSCQISNRWHPKPSSLPRPGLSASVTWCSLGSPASSLTWSGLRTRQEFRRRMEFLCSISSTRHPDACCGRPGDRPLRSLVAPETPSSSFVFAPGRRCSHRCAIQPTKPARSDASGWPCALAGASRQEDDDRNLAAEFSLKCLADECNLSVPHFARAFRHSTGKPPHRWLLDHRVEIAQFMMARSRASLSEIASRCGFTDQSHFTRILLRRSASHQARGAASTARVLCWPLRAVHVDVHFRQEGIAGLISRASWTPASACSWRISPSARP